MKRFWKPWYVWRPRQIVVRGWRGWTRPPDGFLAMRLPSGPRIEADPRRAIGRSIWRTGVYDIAASEALVRLVPRGGMVVDVGANVGYMATLAALAAGPSGHVVAFEPHPEIFQVLKSNLLRLRSHGGAAAVDGRAVALGESAGVGALVVPDEFSGNDGTAHIGTAAAGEREIAVPIDTLDAVIGRGTADVVKLDVEGLEAAVLRGASEVLAGGRIQHLLFEDHAARESEVVDILAGFGYTLFSVGWSVAGPRIEEGVSGIAEWYEAPNYVATLRPDEVRVQFAARGWRVLRPGCGPARG